MPSILLPDLGQGINNPRPAELCDADWHAIHSQRYASNYLIRQLPVSDWFVVILPGKMTPIAICTEDEIVDWLAKSVPVQIQTRSKPAAIKPLKGDELSALLSSLGL